MKHDETKIIKIEENQETKTISYECPICQVKITRSSKFIGQIMCDGNNIKLGRTFKREN